ncbi:MAG: B3/B4 domain-containing protein [Culicoidibacterales bacterium]
MIAVLNDDPRLQNVTLYTYQFDVDVKASTVAPLWETPIILEEIVKVPSIMAQRNLYVELGKQPSRYRSSVEALMRRIAQGKGLYAINNVVDAGNILSLQLGCPIGIYDADEIHGDIHLKVGGEEIYETIGKGVFNIDSLPTLYDERGPFGNPNSDSKRTMVTEMTQRIVVIIFDFNNPPMQNKSIETFITQFQMKL